MPNPLNVPRTAHEKAAQTGGRKGMIPIKITLKEVGFALLCGVCAGVVSYVVNAFLIG